MSVASPCGMRSTGCAGYGTTACSAPSIERRSLGPCSPSISSQSKPVVAQATGRVKLPPSTMPALAALSAMVSSSVPQSGSVFCEAICIARDVSTPGRMEPRRHPVTGL